MNTPSVSQEGRQALLALDTLQLVQMPVGVDPRAFVFKSESALGSEPSRFHAVHVFVN